MKINEYNQMISYLTRREPRKILEEKVKKELKLPPETKVSGSKIVNWINYNNKIHGNNTQPLTADEKKVAADIETYQNPPQVKDKEKLKLEKRIANAKAYIKKPKDKSSWKYSSWGDQEDPKMVDLLPLPPEPKKNLVVKKPKPTIQQQLEFEDYLNTLDPQWWIDEEKPKSKILIREPRGTAQGIQTILNLHKKKIT